MLRTYALSLFLPALAACSSLGGDAGLSDSSSGTSQTGPTSSGSGSSSDAATGSVTEGGSTSVAPHSTDTVGSTGALTTGGTTELNTTGTSGSSSIGSSSVADTGTSGTSGGGVGVCEAALGDYGDCDAVLGVAFNGTECAAISGCDCAPDCDKFFPDVASCALTCAAAGHCNADRLEPAGILKEPVVEGIHCDEVDACVSEPFFKETLEQIFGMLTCEGMGAPCQAGTICHGLWAGTLEGEAWTKTCAATLVPGVGTLFCVVFGP